MISADTIAALEADKIEYILGVRERTSREARAEIIEDDGRAVPLLIPRQKGETELAVRGRRSPGGAMLTVATRRKPNKMPRRAPNSSPVSSASSPRATRRSSPTRASVVS